MTEEFTTKEVLTSRGCFGGWFTDMIILFLILSEKLNIHKVKTKSSFVKIFQWPTEVLSTKISRAFQASSGKLFLDNSKEISKMSFKLIF